MESRELLKYQRGLLTCYYGPCEYNSGLVCRLSRKPRTDPHGQCMEVENPIQDFNHPSGRPPRLTSQLDSRGVVLVMGIQ